MYSKVTKTFSVHVYRKLPSSTAFSPTLQANLPHRTFLRNFPLLLNLHSASLLCLQFCDRHLISGHYRVLYKRTLPSACHTLTPGDFTVRLQGNLHTDQVSHSRESTFKIEVYSYILIFQYYLTSHSLCVFLYRMRLLVVVAAVLVAASAASLSLEDLEFRAWKLKFGKTILQKRVPSYLTLNGLGEDILWLLFID